MCRSLVRWLELGVSGIGNSGGYDCHQLMCSLQGDTLGELGQSKITPEAVLEYGCVRYKVGRL